MLKTRLMLVLWMASFSSASAAEWIRPGLNTNQPVWGIRGGLLWAVAPAGFRRGEPRGLIRLGYPVLEQGRYDLINFIAIEPIVKGKRGYSELERSILDGANGKRISAGGDGRGTVTALTGGQEQQETNGFEQLEVPLQVERFENGAHVRLVLHQRSDRPDELGLDVIQEPDSAQLDYCILTATMGNMARTRQLWLNDEMVSSLKLYQNYSGNGFAPSTEYPLSRLPRTTDGSVLVSISNDEDNPASVYPFPNSEFWHYAGRKVTQYWGKPSGTFSDNLVVVVNARYTYWQSTHPVPGGIAFENFEFREPFRNGQKSIFGITFRTPKNLR